MVQQRLSFECGSQAWQMMFVQWLVLTTAPASSRAATAGAVCCATGCVASHVGLPKPVGWPSICTTPCSTTFKQSKRGRHTSNRSHKVHSSAPTHCNPIATHSTATVSRMLATAVCPTTCMRAQSAVRFTQEHWGAEVSRVSTYYLFTKLQAQLHPVALSSKQLKE